MKGLISVSMVIVAIAAFAQEPASAAGAAAEAAIPAESVKELNKAMSTHVKLSAKSRVDKDIDAWCRETGVTLGFVKGKSAFYIKGVANVVDNVASSTFVKSRSLAYSKAYQNAVAEYIFRRFGDSVSEQYQRTFNDFSKGVSGEDVKGAFDRIAEKTAQLTEAKLDEGLRKLGVTPSGSVVEKRKLAQNLIVKRSVKRASGDSAGLLPVQTFEGWTESGKYAVGVVVRGGVETEILAESFRNKTRPRLSRPEAGMTVEQALPDEDELVSQFGVRMFFDENGTPALLSIGHWGSSYVGEDEDLAESALDHAREQAEDEADDALTMFINSTLTMLSESERGEDSGRAVETYSDGAAVERDIRMSLDRKFKESTMRGSDKMIGRMPAPGFPKVVVHPNNGHKIAVAAVVWSFDQYDAMNRTAPRPKQQKATPTKTSAPGNRRGKTYDF